MPPISTSQCHLSVPVSAAYECANQCHLSVPVSSAYQCPLVPPISAAYQCHQCLLISAHQCHLSVPISAASLVHINEGEKLLIYKILEQKLRKNFF
ncbi:unnamed protein product [Staurois parvus]|uniref:Uncharacterized protein n=1 Tax=Staurois parvus TaxID=386267 RepID=A0ABN9FYM9_9NEOB|nr:unnamed protein product [Staurois parvus]